MNRGGIEAFMMNYLRYMDLNRIHIDFAVRGPEKGNYHDLSFDFFVQTFACRKKSSLFEKEKMLKLYLNILNNKEAKNEQR